MDRRTNHEGDVAAIGRIAAVPTILEIVCRITGLGFAAVARVTEDRWIACGVRDAIAFGLQPGDELPVESTICHEIRDSREAVVINHVADDPVWARHHTPLAYGFQSYISMPILLPDGRFFGTLCAIDPAPARLDTPEIVGMFRMFADLIGFHLDADERLATSEARLTHAQETEALREQFIAVLGHDLRNPLASLISGIGLVEREQPSERAIKVLAMMRQSAARMNGLIGDVLDFARGRLGGGLTLERQDCEIGPLIEQVVDEYRQLHPARTITLECRAGDAVACDPARLGQLLANLLDNAVRHGAAGAPIAVTCDIAGANLRLAVTNRGVPIAAAARARLFQPYRREGTRGLGLGLYIAQQIALAHGGTIAVQSTDERTRFRFEMPLSRARPKR